MLVPRGKGICFSRDPSLEESKGSGPHQGNPRPLTWPLPVWSLILTHCFQEWFCSSSGLEARPGEAVQGLDLGPS